MVIIFKNNKGFSVVHLIVVIAVLAILVTMGLPRLTGRVREARALSLVHDSRLLEDAITRYHIKYGHFPRLGSPLAQNQIEGTLVHHSDIVIDEAFWANVGLATTNPTHPNAIRLFRIDAAAIAPYVRINSDISNFVLRNPYGTVFAIVPNRDSPTIAMAPHLRYATFTTSPVTLKAIPKNADNIASVRFYANGHYIGHTTSTPWSFVWDAPNDMPFVHAVMVMSSGKTIASAPVRMVINAPRQTTVYAEIDAYSLAGSLRGTGNTISVGAGNYNALLRFNICANHHVAQSNIISAKLVTSNPLLNSASSGDFSIKRILTLWDELSINAPELGYFAGSAFPYVSPNLINGWISGGLEILENGWWMTGEVLSINNFGLAIVTTQPLQSFNSREAGLDIPRLIVTYNDRNLVTRLTAIISSTPNWGRITTATQFTWDHTTSLDPFRRPIVAAEWRKNNGPVTTTPPNGTFTVGNHTIGLRVQNSVGEWSKWTEQTITVHPAP